MKGAHTANLVVVSCVWSGEAGELKLNKMLSYLINKQNSKQTNKKALFYLCFLKNHEDFALVFPRASNLTLLFCSITIPQSILLYGSSFNT